MAEMQRETTYCPKCRPPLLSEEMGTYDRAKIKIAEAEKKTFDYYYTLTPDEQGWHLNFFAECYRCGYKAEHGVIVPHHQIDSAAAQEEE